MENKKISTKREKEREQKRELKKLQKEERANLESIRNLFRESRKITKE